MKKHIHPLAGALIVGLLVTVLAACGLGGPSKEQQWESALQKAGMSVSGVASAQADATVNTSGKFIAVKLVGETAEKELLARTLQDAIPVLLESIRDVDGGTFGVSIFSPDGNVSAGPRDLGYNGPSSLSSVREFFAK